MGKRVGLFVPCYVNDFYPEAAFSTLEVLESLGFDVVYPENQSCCGQPFLNNGMVYDARKLAERFVDIFADFDFVVAPSSSCIGAVKHRYDGIVKDARYPLLRQRVYELCEFLHDVVGIENLRFQTPFRGRVGLHNSCHALRELGLAAPSELHIPPFSKVRAVLSKIEGLEVVEPSRDECCGFGGTFSIQESAVSAMMGRDRIADHRTNGVDIVAGVDMSCLMHMEGLAKRDGIPVRFVHVAQLMTGRV
ncbi:(Fe-S)-binding protein [Hydrogenimonas urashimensis]|uniref:(Fe-S)-binding protein n=1 Tax=Hydrogenimonas urashimensis TaxID=2740515 RepID=UPI00191547EB|nr:(Fe-S)-binding protein [Hydrogenimonas urashimensis]